MSFSHDVPPDVRLKRKSTFESLEEIVDAAQEFAAKVFADEDAAYRFVLALSEAVANAIEHGNALDPQKYIIAEFRVLETRVEAVVTDEGGGFDPSAVEDPFDEANLERTHGRGLHIINQVANEVCYEAEGRRVRMSFSCEA